MPGILIIEDEPKVAESLLLGLRELDFEVEWAPTGEDGLTCILENQPDVVVLEPGDYINIPAHVKHRVEWTSRDEETVWLAVHY